MIKIKKLLSNGIAAIDALKERIDEQITEPNEKYINSIRVLDGVIITPISEVRNAREALLSKVSTSEDLPTRDELEKALRRFSILQTQI